ncbi:hypothetical protein [Furfurilactobacillus entadae]|uniref:hypothetical protein n=1 Tax=Furfurilactobacillus entadae TaxID=2922307 RepID=UPI0035EF8DFE
MQILSEIGWGWWLIAIVLLGTWIYEIFWTISEMKKGTTDELRLFFGPFAILAVSMIFFLFFSCVVSSATRQNQPYNTETIRPQKIISVKKYNVSYLAHDEHAVKSTNDFLSDYSHSVTRGMVSVGQPKIVIKYYHQKITSEAFKVPDQWLATQVIVDATVPKSQISSLYLDN